MYKHFKAWYTVYMMRKEPAKITLLRDHKFAETFRKEGKFATKSIAETVPMELVKSMMSKSRISPADSRVLVMFSVEMAASLKYYGVKNVVFTTDVYDDFMRRFVEKYFDYKYMTLDDIKENDMKFDSVLANPPYDGVKELHQRFFNKSVNELVVDGGTVCFLQPATIYNNKKPNQKSESRMMQANVKQHTTHVTMQDPKIFKKAKLRAGLSVTMLIKDDSNSGVIDTLDYLSGERHESIDLQDVNKLEMNPSVYRSIYDKILYQVSLNGALASIAEWNQPGLKITHMNGNAGPEHYSLLNKSENLREYISEPSNDKFTMRIAKEEVPNAVSYLETFILRFALSLHKYNEQFNRGELKSVPLVDFNQEWTDEKLMAEWGITEDEYAEILKVIPAYYD